MKGALMGYSVGRSSFGDLAGVEQFVASSDVANQVASLCFEFDTAVAQNGDRLTVNEGIRSRPRQKMLRDAWDTYQRDGYPWAALAAVVYTSTHDQSRGSALDFGITRKDGSNRALTQAEFDWVHANGVRRGIRWTGASFRPVEQWHHNGGYAASVAPIPGVRLPGSPIPVAPAVEDTKETDDMRITWDASGQKPTLWDGTRSWEMTNITVAGARIQLPQTLDLVRRFIRADQGKDVPAQFNDLEKAILMTAFGNLK